MIWQLFSLKQEDKTAGFQLQSSTVLHAGTTLTKSHTPSFWKCWSSSACSGTFFPVASCHGHSYLTSPNAVPKRNQNSHCLWDLCGQPSLEEGSREWGDRRGTPHKLVQKRLWTVPLWVACLLFLWLTVGGTAIPLDQPRFMTSFSFCFREWGSQTANLWLLPSFQIKTHFRTSAQLLVPFYRADFSWWSFLSLTYLSVTPQKADLYGKGTINYGLNQHLRVNLWSGKTNIWYHF